MDILTLSVALIAFVFSHFIQGSNSCCIFCDSDKKCGNFTNVLCAVKTDHDGALKYQTRKFVGMSLPWTGVNITNLCNNVTYPFPWRNIHTTHNAVLYLHVQSVRQLSCLPLSVESKSNYKCNCTNFISDKVKIITKPTGHLLIEPSKYPDMKHQGSEKPSIRTAVYTTPFSIDQNKTKTSHSAGYTYKYVLMISIVAVGGMTVIAVSVICIICIQKRYNVKLSTTKDEHNDSGTSNPDNVSESQFDIADNVLYISADDEIFYEKGHYAEIPAHSQTILKIHNDSTDTDDYSNTPDKAVGYSNTIKTNDGYWQTMESEIAETLAKLDSASDDQGNIGSNAKHDDFPIYAVVMKKKKDHL